MADSITQLLRDSSVMSLVAKMETGELRSQDVDNFILRQQAETVRAGQLALLEAIEVQERADANAERFLATGDAEELRPFFQQRDVRQ